MRSRALANILNMVQEQELPIERQFLNDLKASIEITDQKNARQPSQSYKPSSLHCIRNMFYQVMGVKPQNDRASSELIGICENGTDRHERIQKAVADMKENGMDCEYVDVGEYVKTHNLPDLEVISKNGMETKLFNKRLNISFLCDGVIRYRGKYYILEIKTETSNKFWNRENVNPAHELQGTAYSLNLGLENVIFLYECRDNCTKKTFMFHVTDEMRNALEEKIKQCDEFISNNEVPPKPEDAGPKMCAYCNYAERCKIDG